MKSTLVAIFIFVLSAAATPAQPNPKTSSGFDSSQPISLEANLKLPHNAPDILRSELLDTNNLLLIAGSVGLKQSDFSQFGVSPGPVEGQVWFSQSGKGNAEVQNRIGERLFLYSNARRNGHTRECLLAGLTNRLPVATIGDPDLRILATNYVILPPSWFKKEGSDVVTNDVGQLIRRVSYFLVDGEIAWHYHLVFNPDGSLAHVSDLMRDAKEVDPKFKAKIDAVDREIEAERKQNGTPRAFGSGPGSIEKKKRLHALGIEWRSPGELNSVEDLN